MFDVYLNTKRDLLVVRNGLPIPLPDASGRWRKKKKVASVSEDIKLAVQRQGYYMRKLTDFKESNIDVREDSTVSHINIDKSARIQAEIEREIGAVAKAN
jgi:hypothetical protein